MESPLREPVIQEKLPLPSFGSENLNVKNSVFANPFIEAENAKEAILEKHVKMIPAKDDLTNINGKKICWMYRKGRCRFGHNCKYAHDSDVHNTEQNSFTAENSEKCMEQSSTISVTIESNSDNVKNSDSNLLKSSDNSTVKKKKRPGLSQALVPGKKVLNMYKKQKLSDSTTVSDI
ncbi:uncharacterized protein LOC142323721 isoform X2 [Lycorma delicatula]|uniref:uncharacterized protein LOC142323721 isoform X2 n=1 Tax=Lycorma delicatula TaxID=130591 RepID=UPI003F5158CE